MMTNSRGKTTTIAAAFLMILAMSVALFALPAEKQYVTAQITTYVCVLCREECSSVVRCGSMLVSMSWWVFYGQVLIHARTIWDSYRIFCRNQSLFSHIPCILDIVFLLFLGKLPKGNRTDF
jgi:hypothetical protein